MVKIREKKKRWKPPPEKQAWIDMKSRCLNPKHKKYNDYGGRGITISDEWLSDFKVFLRDMGKRPEGRYSIERINNNEGYSKENCKWATQKEQLANRRTTIYLDYNGITKKMVEWALILEMPYKKFNKAIIRYKTVDAACRNYKGGILNKKVQDFYSLHVDSFGHPPENRLL